MSVSFRALWRLAKFQSHIEPVEPFVREVTGSSTLARPGFEYVAAVTYASALKKFQMSSCLLCVTVKKRHCDCIGTASRVSSLRSLG